MFSGNSFACTPNLKSVVLVSASKSDMPDGVVCNAGKPLVRSVLMTVANCVYKDDEVERISPALLGVFLRCYGAANEPSSSFAQVLSAHVMDPALAKACNTAVNLIGNSKSTGASGCKSVYHVQNPAPLDLRSRLPRCSKCYETEDSVRKAAWPVVASLSQRLVRPVYEEVLKAIKKLSRSNLLRLLGRTVHDLQLVKTPSIHRQTHWLFKVTPHAVAINHMRRSKQCDFFVANVDKLVERGWAVAPEGRIRQNRAASIVIVNSVMLLTDFFDAVKFLSCANVIFHATAPGKTHESAGPLENYTLRQFSEKLAEGVRVFHGCRALRSSAALELLALFGKLNLNVKRAPLGPEHVYIGTDPAVRAHLAAEESTEWVNVESHDKLVELVHSFRAGRNGEARVCGVLRTAKRGGSKRRQKAAPDGEEPPKRPALAAAETDEDIGGRGREEAPRDRAPADESGPGGDNRQVLGSDQECDPAPGAAEECNRNGCARTNLPSDDGARFAATRDYSGVYIS